MPDKTPYCVSGYWKNSSLRRMHVIWNRDFIEHGTRMKIIHRKMRYEDAGQRCVIVAWERIKLGPTEGFKKFKAKVPEQNAEQAEARAAYSMHGCTSWPSRDSPSRTCSSRRRGSAEAGRTVSVMHGHGVTYL